MSTEEIDLDITKTVSQLLTEYSDVDFFNSPFLTTKEKNALINADNSDTPFSDLSDDDKSIIKKIFYKIPILSSLTVISEKYIDQSNSEQVSAFNTFRSVLTNSSKLVDDEMDKNDSIASEEYQLSSDAIDKIDFDFIIKQLMPLLEKVKDDDEKFRNRRDVKGYGDQTLNEVLNKHNEYFGKDIFSDSPFLTKKEKSFLKRYGLIESDSTNSSKKETTLKDLSNKDFEIFDTITKTIPALEGLRTLSEEFIDKQDEEQISAYRKLREIITAPEGKPTNVENIDFNDLILKLKPAKYRELEYIQETFFDTFYTIVTSNMIPDSGTNIDKSLDPYGRDNYLDQDNLDNYLKKDMRTLLNNAIKSIKSDTPKSRRARRKLSKEDLNSSAELKIKNTFEYILSQSVLNSVLATGLMIAKLTQRIFPSLKFPFREKSSESIQRNFYTTFMKFLDSLQNVLYNNNECLTKEKIDSLKDKVYSDIITDIYAGTLVIHDNNLGDTLTKKCRSIINKDPSEDSSLNENQRKSEEEYRKTIKKLYRQKKAVALYIENSSGESESEFDETQILTDESGSDKTLKLCNPSEIDTLKDFYEQYISVLRILSSISMHEVTDPSKNKKGPKCIICEKNMDIKYFIKLAESNSNLKTDLDRIKFINELIRKKWIGTEEEPAHIPFDKQLEKALAEQANLINNPEYNAKLTPYKRLQLEVELCHLMDIVEALNGQKLLHTILEHEAPKLIEKVADQFPFNEVSLGKSKFKVVAKPNGFYAIYLIITLNNGVKFELQIHSEYFESLAKEGSAAHNTALKKGINQTQFVTPKNDSESLRENFEEYVFFLSHIPNIFYGQPDYEYITTLLDTCSNYINIEIPLANTKTQKKIFFEQFLKYLGGVFYDITPSHTSAQSGSLRVTKQPLRITFLDLTKNSIGSSYLSDLIKELISDVDTFYKDFTFKDIQNYMEQSQKRIKDAKEVIEKCLEYFSKQNGFNDSLSSPNLYQGYKSSNRNPHSEGLR